MALPSRPSQLPRDASLSVKQGEIERHHFETNEYDFIPWLAPLTL